MNIYKNYEYFKIHFYKYIYKIVKIEDLISFFFSKKKFFTRGSNKLNDNRIKTKFTI